MLESLKATRVGLGPVLQVCLDVCVQKAWVPEVFKSLKARRVGLGPVLQLGLDVCVYKAWVPAMLESLKTRRVGLGPVLQVGLDGRQLLYLLKVGLHQGVFLLQNVYNEWKVSWEPYAGELKFICISIFFKYFVLTKMVNLSSKPSRSLKLFSSGQPIHPKTTCKFLGLLTDSVTIY